MRIQYKKYEEENTLKDAVCSECGNKVNSFVDLMQDGDYFNDEWLSDLKRVTASNVIQPKAQNTREQTKKLLSAYEYEEHMDGTYTIIGLADKNALSIIIPEGVKSIGFD